MTTLYGMKGLIIATAVIVAACLVIGYFAIDWDEEEDDDDFYNPRD